jgi:integrase
VVAGRDALRLPRASWTGFNVWDKAQADKFLTVMQGHRLEGWFLFALIHGLRMSEILGLQWEDIDLAHDTMKIRRQLQDGKLVALKTGSAAVRSIRLHPSVLYVLKKMDNREGFLLSTEHPILTVGPRSVAHLPGERRRHAYHGSLCMTFATRP